MPNKIRLKIVLPRNTRSEKYILHTRMRQVANILCALCANNTGEIEIYTRQESSMIHLTSPQSRPALILAGF